MSLYSATTFGDLLKQLRKRAGLTQRELAAAVGYSLPFISNLELNQRLPDVAMVAQCFVPALGLQDDPVLRVRLIEQAAARGERPPAARIAAPMTAAVASVDIGPTCHVPTLPTAVIGRTAELAQISNRLVEHTGRLLTLVGPPGVGKTTLALAVATHLQPHYPDGVVFVSLAPINDAMAMAMTILAAVGGSDASPKPPTTRLIALLRRKKMLLVLDNVEQIGEAASLIGELLGACPQLCILATSREWLHLRAEQRYRVPPLEYERLAALSR